jgi:hypothetical protein
VVFYLANINWTAAISVLPALHHRHLHLRHCARGGEEFTCKRPSSMADYSAFFTYATYDLTNLATLKDWPLPIVFIDIIWGVVLTALVSTAGYFITKWVG